VSTAADQFRLILDALEIQAFRQIVAMPQATVTGARWPRLRRARRSSAGHAAEHGTRFDDLRVFRSLPRRFSEAVITPPGSLGGAGVAGTLSTIPTIMI
jgi:hypothetical protein